MIRKYAVRISLGGEEDLLMWINHSGNKPITQEQVKDIVHQRLHIVHRELVSKDDTISLSVKE